MLEAFPDWFTGLSVKVQAHDNQVADAGEGAEIYLSATASPRGTPNDEDDEPTQPASLNSQLSIF
jgi:hypothetical protein